jgi:hypothetical protein
MGKVFLHDEKLLFELSNTDEFLLDYANIVKPMVGDYFICNFKPRHSPQNWFPANSTKAAKDIITKNYGLGVRAKWKKIN